jgi:hypothetical protein
VSRRCSVEPDKTWIAGTKLAMTKKWIAAKLVTSAETKNARRSLAGLSDRA